MLINSRANIVVAAPWRLTCQRIFRAALVTGFCPSRSPASDGTNWVSKMKGTTLIFKQLYFVGENLFLLLNLIFLRLLKF